MTTTEQRQSFAADILKGSLFWNLPSARREAMEVAIPYRRQTPNNRSQLTKSALDFLNQESDGVSLVITIQKEVDQFIAQGYSCGVGSSYLRPWTVKMVGTAARGETDAFENLLQLLLPRSTWRHAAPAQCRKPDVLARLESSISPDMGWKKSAERAP